MATGAERYCGGEQKKQTMITLHKLPFEDNLDLEWMMSFDTKKNILEHCRLVDVAVNRNLRKAEIGFALADFFQRDPFWTVNKLSAEEQSLLAKLVVFKSGDCLTYPRNDDKFLQMQKLHLVVTYQTDSEWKIFMPDCIRKIISRGAEADIDYHPGMREFNDTLEALTKCNVRIQELMDTDPIVTMTLPHLETELNRLESEYKRGLAKVLELCKKYDWAKKSKVKVEQSVDGALEFIAQVKKMRKLFIP